MQIAIHLTTGSVRRFEQTDPALVQQNLNLIVPKTLFQAPLITIGGDFHATAFPTRLVTRVELSGAQLPDWTQAHNVSEVRVISEDEFLAGVRHGEGAEELRRTRARRDGEEFLVFLELEDVTGGRLHLEAKGTLLASVVRKHALARLLEGPFLHARLGDAGVVLVNPANVACLSLYPGTPELPLAAWIAHYKG